MIKKTKGLGIRGMRERVESLGGTFTIKSVPKTILNRERRNL